MLVIFQLRDRWHFQHLIVLIVSVALLLKLQIPIQQKTILVTVFGIGIFVTAAEAFTKVYSFDHALIS